MIIPVGGDNETEKWPMMRDGHGKSISKVRKGTTIEELPATRATLVNETHERVSGVIPVSRVREHARASGRAHSGVSVTAAYWLPNKSSPVKSIPGPSGKRRNDGLLSPNRETLGTEGPTRRNTVTPAL
ncbi:hypothetical protein K0M31_005160 [Melipona bicolor]|uniref:Uncharacterized protein n=1 Tax=Melipona bicolor TaxID=60889 RepID=A0AA40KMH9_9HYME|nr:hypothetical protein K0M31_005160 [Melipona bicolor]